MDKDKKGKKSINKKKRKGFTLAEILGVIVIVGMLLLIVAPNIINRIRGNSDAAEEAANKIIYSAGREYVNERPEEYRPGHGYCVKISDLVKVGKLAAPVVDVKSGDNIENSKSVFVIVLQNGVVESQLFKNEDCTPENIESVEREISVAYNGIKINVTPDDSDKTWTKQRSFTIDFPSLTTNRRYSMDGGKTWKNYNDGDSIPVSINKSKVLAKAKLINIGVENSRTITYLDSIAPSTPSITNPTNGNWTKNNFSLALKSSDNKDGTEGSGLAYYQYKYANTDWITYNDSAKPSFTTTVFSAERNENVYIRACDKVGNCSDESNTMIRLDHTAPTVPNITNPTNGNWTKNDFSLTLSSNDNPGGTNTGASGLNYYQYSYDNNGWNTYNNSASTSFVTTAFSAERNQLAYLRVCDKAGNCSGSSNTWIRIDKTGPKFNGEIFSYWNSTSLGYRHFFGRNVTDSGAGLSNGNTNLYYCYESLPAGCGRSCTAGGYSGNAWNEPGTGNWLDLAQFDRPSEGATNYNMYSGVDGDCARNRCIRSYYRACDRVGNCSTYGVQRNCYDNRGR